MMDICVSGNCYFINDHLQRAIDRAERRIDELVYELYGLAKEKVGIVEGREIRA